MDKPTVIEKVKALGASPSCCEELKVAVKYYLDALGKPYEKDAAENLIKVTKASITPIELLVIRAHSNSTIEKFGVEAAKKIAAHADALKASGAKYCNCSACTLGLEILDHKDVLLK